MAAVLPQHTTANPLNRFRSYANLVKFSHTVFAMPFALSMLVLLSRSHSIQLTQLLWIIIALVSARTAAMTYNRIVDRDIDARNPRTKSRELPSGILSIRSMLSLFALSVLFFLLSAGLLGLHCLMLAPLVLGALLFYSHTKRFTSVTHLVLGFALALAPGGVWYALTAKFAVTPLFLMAAVLFWVAGFDVLYSCQDRDFDRSEGLFSIPRTIGVKKSFLVARVFHLLAVGFLIAFGQSMHLGGVYLFSVVVFSFVMFSQHLLVSPNDLSRIDEAFFTRNGVASILFFLGCCAEVWVS